MHLFVFIVTDVNARDVRLMSGYSGGIDCKWFKRQAFYILCQTYIQLIGSRDVRLMSGKPQLHQIQLIQLM